MFTILVRSLLLVALVAPCLLLPGRGSASPAADSACISPLDVGAPSSAVPRLRFGAPPAPSVSAEAAAVIDGESGRLLYDLRAREHRAPASTTKIMTAILALERGDLDRHVVSETDATRMVGSSVMGLRVGVPISVRDLLYGLMLPSGNDAALEIARAVDGSVPAFVEHMNRKAAEIGLMDTSFQNPHGLDGRQHYSSAYDLALLGRYAMGNAEFATLARARTWHLAPPSDYALYNGNSLLNLYPGADGIKIGWTRRAGWTLVASAVRDGRRVFVTVLKSNDRDADAAALLDWAYAAHEWVPVSPELSVLLRLAQRLGAESTVARALSVCV
jgi:D-alanyl-D-alanine carboxypeptidase